MRSPFALNIYEKKLFDLNRFCGHSKNETSSLFRTVHTIWKPAQQQQKKKKKTISIVCKGRGVLKYQKILYFQKIYTTKKYRKELLERLQDILNGVTYRLHSLQY